MVKKNQNRIVCARCKKTFERPRPTGRMPRYCSPRCRASSHRQRNASADVPRSYDEDVERIARTIASNARLLERISRNPIRARPLERIHALAVLRRDVEDYLAVAVRAAHQQGAEMKEIGAVLAVAPSTLKGRYSEAQVDRIIRNRKERRPATLRPQPPTRIPLPRSGRKPKQITALNRSMPGFPGHALARALSHMHRSSGKTVQEIAILTGVSASYVYRIMLGQRTPQWGVVRRFAVTCKVSPDDLVVLWNTAQGLRPELPRAGTAPEALSVLQAALRGLHLAAARPSPEDLVTGAASSSLHVREVQVLLGLEPGRPRSTWESVRALTVVLRGEEADIRPLWDAYEKAGRSEGIALGPSAQAFG